MAQLNCQEAERYLPQDLTNSESPQTSEVYPDYAQETTLRKLQEERRRNITIDIIQTEETEKDIERLRKIIDTLKNYPGEDEISLKMINGDEITNLEMPNMTVRYCPDLENELSNILDRNSLRFVNF